MRKWIKHHPDVSYIRPAIWDINGIMRGKHIPRAVAMQNDSPNMKLPLSALGIDIWGTDVISSHHVMETGDRDGLCQPTGREAITVKAVGPVQALLPMWMFTQDGTPYDACPRHLLNTILKRYHSRKLFPVCAIELEFFLYERRSLPLRPPMQLGGNHHIPAAQMYSLDHLDQITPFLDELYQICTQANISTEAAISESGAGQIEINCQHNSDILKIADDALLFKYIVKTLARKYDMGATFMAKPYGDQPGNGLHVHFSLLDENQKNLFDDKGDPKGSEQLRQAVAGMLYTSCDFFLLFAPHFNSYRRLRTDSHAPIHLSWGYDNRTAALRIPSSSPNARRIEHRLAGADANPYLVLCALLGGAWLGMEKNQQPPAPISGNAYAQDLPRLPNHWESAMNAFAQSEHVTEIFSPLFQQIYSAAKAQEQARFTHHITQLEYETYLDTV